MTTRVEGFAKQIASVDESELQALLERVEELSLRQGLRAMANRYRRQLRKQGEINESAEGIFRKLKHIREEIASREYPG